MTKSCRSLPLVKEFHALTLLATVNKLSGVDALGSNKQLRPLLEAVRVTEGHLGQGGATAGVMDDVLKGRDEGVNQQGRTGGGGVF